MGAYLYKKIVLTLCIFSLCIGWLQTVQATEVVFQEKYQALLRQYVRAGTLEGVRLHVVDYKAWRHDDLHRDAFAALLASQEPPIGDRNARMAYWINAYNFLTIELIISHGETESIKNLGSLLQSPWKKYTWQIAGQVVSLDEIEHKILRKMGDPRIHMAIVCASISCPDLRREVYMASKLDDQLFDQVKRFLTNETKGLAEDGPEIKVSKIFDWFKEDFGGKEGVEKFIADSIGLQEPREVIGYFDYHWGLNSIRY